MFEILKTEGKARRGVFTCAHGTVQTPVFMNVGTQAATVGEGLSNVFGLVAFIAVNLAVMNLLPIPALDGGRLLFILIELVTGKRVPEKFEGLVHLIGFILLMALMVFVLFNDVLRLFNK